MGDAGAWGGRPIVSDKDWRKGSEYGGVEGLIAPADSGHSPNDVASEQLMLVYNSDAGVDEQVVILPETKKIRGYGE